MVRRLFPIFHGRTTMEMAGQVFRCKAIGSRMRSAMMPEPAPTLQQLLAFYLEAGVDCALAEQPANRLSDLDTLAGASETAPTRPINITPAAIPAMRGET